MQQDTKTRREFLADGAALAGGIALAGNAAAAPAKGKILNYNPNMEYRRLGRTGLMVSAICMGGHWKRVQTVVKGTVPNLGGYVQADLDNVNSPEFLKNRHEIVSRAIEAGINYVDACTGPEVLAYSKVLQGRRDEMYLGYSWHMRESRRKEWRSAARLIQGLDQGLKEAGLDYVDLWRITLPMDQGHHDMISLADIREVEEGAMEALLKARQQGKARFTGVSSHNRTWLKSLIEQYHEAVYVVLFPYTAGSKELPTDSIFRAVRKADVGVLGIKPFADNALFKGDGTINSPHAEEDSRRARLALRYILSNPAVTAPIPGLINAEQVKNAAQAVMERRKLDVNEKAELDGAAEQMWANLSPSHLWLKEWERV